MKFKNKTTGVIITTENEFVIGQMSKSADYEEVKTKKEEKKTVNVESKIEIEKKKK